MIDTNRLIAMREIETNLRAEGQSSRADCFLELSDEIDRLRAELAETQTVKDSFTVPYDYALLLDENAAMREEIGELRDELTELRNPDCRTCLSYGLAAGCPLARNGCVSGSMYVARWSEPMPVRLYENE